MPYEYKITRLEWRYDDGVLTGLVIGVTCTKLSDKGQAVSSAYMDWYVDKEKLASWPLDEKQLKDYIVAYLRSKPAEEAKNSQADILAAQTDVPVTTYQQLNILSADKLEL